MPTVIAVSKKENASKASTGNMFYFKTDIGVSTGECASDLTSFYDTLENIDVKSIEFHMNRGDFDKWLKSLGHYWMASDVEKLSKKDLVGESLRAELRNTVKKKLLLCRMFGWTSRKLGAMS